jgi:hypothetical protein
MITIQNYHFEDIPRIHIKCDVMPGQHYLKSTKIVEYPSLPGVIELWIFAIDGWNVYDQITRTLPAMQSTPAPMPGYERGDLP